MNDQLVHAPYNFVPFSTKKPFLRYQGISELPAHNRIRTDLKSGEIHVTLKAETPVFVSDGNEHFFRGPDGRYMIPGSTLRGLIRENMMILGYGVMLPGEDMEDYRVFFREMASARESTGGPLKDYYKELLQIETQKSSGGKTYSIPQKVQSGYLFSENGKYFIRPTSAPYLRISRKNPEVQIFGKGDARTIPVAYFCTGDRVTKIVRQADAEPGMQNGILLYTGKSVGKEPNHLYLFPAADDSAYTEEVDDADILSYRKDLEARRNSLNAYYNVSFWELPKDAESKPVFYTTVNGHLYFGMSLFLRIGYPHSLGEGLPSAHRELTEQISLPLDYPHAMFGFASKADSYRSRYRSRVSVEDFPLINAVTELPSVNTILGGPKPSYYPGYVENGEHYANDGFRLRGYKQYWLHEINEKPTQESKEKVGSTLRPLPAGSVFRGVIRFKNLAEDELGLLLWALRLEKRCFQTLGMGKPYGYGRMKFTIDALLEADWSSLYGDSLDSAHMKDCTQKADAYIGSFDEYISKMLYIKKPSKEHPSITSQPEIQDFFFIKSAIRPTDEASYMELGEYKKKRDSLPVIASVRSKTEPQRTPTAPAVDDDPLAALRNKFRGL